MSIESKDLVTGVRQHWRTQPANLRGAFWMVAAVTGFTFTAVAVKVLSEGGIDAFQSSVARSVIGLVIILPLMARGKARGGGWEMMKTSHPWLHLLRALAGAGAMVFGYYAYTLMPLVEVTAISFSTALFTVILAALVLREQVGWRRWGATLLGFIGVLAMLRPGAASFTPEALLPIGMALGFAVAVTVVKILPKDESRLTLLFYFFLMTICMAAPLADWRWPDPSQWMLLALLGLLGAASQSMIISAFKVGDASFVAPFDYIRLLLAWLVGQAFFAESPDIWTLVGAAVIIASSLYIARREARRRADATKEEITLPAGGS